MKLWGCANPNDVETALEKIVLAGKAAAHDASFASRPLENLQKNSQKIEDRKDEANDPGPRDVVVDRIGSK